MTKLKLLFCIILLFVSTKLIAYPLEPTTSGSLCTTSHRDFDGLRYAESIAHCKRNVSTRFKNEICLDYGVRNRRDYKVDHIIPLSIGGDNSRENLWCQNKAIDTAPFEYDVYRLIKGGDVTQAEAIKLIMERKFHW